MKQESISWSRAECCTVAAVLPNENGSISNSIGSLSGPNNEPSCDPGPSFRRESIKLSTKEIMTESNVICMIMPESIVKRYLTYSQGCGVNGVNGKHFTPLSRRALLRILTVCSAFVRKSLQGLDYKSSAGSQVFDDLADVVNRFGTT